MKKIFLLFNFLFITFLLHGQNSYPIQTILKGDSVVIYTTDQSNDLNLTIENQRFLSSTYKTKLEDYSKKIDSLEKNINNKQMVIDSLYLTHKNQDSLQQRLYVLENWLIKASIDNSYIYMSWPDHTIKFVDLTLYTVHCSMQNGTLRMIRRGPNDEFEIWKGLNYIRKESPEIGWEMKYTEDERPIVKNLPINIKINDYK
jgi:hypothetical protein